MKIRKELVLFVGCFLQSVFAFSQENFTPGYVVNMAGDTIQGEIDYRSWGVNPDRIYFKKAGESSAEMFTPLGIRSFNVAGEFYYSGIVQAEKSSQNTQNITRDRSFSFETDTTFLQALVVGEKSLFHYLDRDERTNYYISTESGFELLKVKLYLISHNERLIKRRNKTYVSQLTNYFGDCEGVLKRLEDVEYTKRSLMKAFNAYYACKGQSAFYVHEEPKGQLAVNALAGVGSVAFGSVRTIAPTAGLSLDFVYPRWLKKWSVNNDILFSRIATAGSYQFNQNGRENLYEYEYEMITFRLLHMVRYRYPVNNTRLFFNAGFIHRYSFVSKDYLKKTSNFGPDSNEEYSESYPFNKEVSIGYMAGAGILYNRFSVEARVEKAIGILGLSSRTFSILAGYRVNK